MTEHWLDKELFDIVRACHCDSEADISFEMDIAWIELLKTLLVTVYVAYFGSRGAEKVFINKDKNK